MAASRFFLAWLFLKLTITLSRYFCVASTYFNVLCVEYTILVYCHEQEAVRGRVSGSQALGSLFYRPQVWLVWGEA